MGIFKFNLAIDEKYKELIQQLIKVGIMSIFVILLHGLKNDKPLTAWELFVYSIVGKLFYLMVFNEVVEFV